MLRSWRAVMALAAAAAAALVTAAPAHAAISVKIHPIGKLDGAAIVVRVQVSCTPGRPVLEAGLTASQDDQNIWGMTGLGRLTCDGKRRWYTVRVTPFDGAFHAGPAYISAFVILYDETSQDTESEGDTRTINVK